MSQINNPTGIPKQRPQKWYSDFNISRYFHEIEEFIRQVYDNLTGITRLRTYEVANLPDAGDFDPEDGGAALIYVSDESGGAVLAFSDGTNWRRVTDRAIVS